MRVFLKIFLALILVKQVQVHALTCTQILSVEKYRLEDLKNSPNLEVYADEETFTVYERNGQFHFQAFHYGDGPLVLAMKLKDKFTGERSWLKGHMLYQTMMEHFGVENIDAIAESWSSGDNYDVYQEAVAKGKTKEEAALLTWGGQQAVNFGFSFVEEVEVKEGGAILAMLRKPGEYEKGLEILLPSSFEWVDPHNSVYSLTGTLENGVLSFRIRMRSSINNDRSKFQGNKVFAMMIEHFGSYRIKKIQGDWKGGSNFNEF